MKPKAVLMIGLFVDPEYPEKNIRTTADRNAEMFAKYGIKHITTSNKSGRLSRLYDNIQTLFKEKKNYDVGVVPMFGTWLSFIWQALMVFLLKKLKKKVIISVHGGSIPWRMNKNANRFLNALKKADIIICPSAYLINHFEKFDLKPILVENPVNLSNYIFTKKERIRPHIIWMRALSDVYNPLMAVRVAAILSKKYPDFKMIIAGKDGELSEATKQMTHSFDLSEKIKFPGYISLREKISNAKDFDIYICTNKIDNAPVSLIEFMALGLPVVSVNAGGIPDMITHNKNGLLVDPDADNAMAEQIEKLIQQPVFASEIINNAHIYAQQYDDKNVIRKWKNILEEITGQKFFLTEKSSVKLQ